MAVVLLDAAVKVIVDIHLSIVDPEKPPPPAIPPQKAPLGVVFTSIEPAVMQLLIVTTVFWDEPKIPPIWQLV